MGLNLKFYFSRKINKYFHADNLITIHKLNLLLLLQVQSKVFYKDLLSFFWLVIALFAS
jgi:hypothetical protein